MANMPKRLQLLKSFPSGGGGSGGGAQSDWNAAEGESGHVLNRTHWAEITRVDVLPIGSFALDEDAYCEVNIDRPMSVGKSYIIAINGVEYERKAVLDEAFECPYIGDMRIFNGKSPESENDDGFCFIDFGDDLAVIVMDISEYASETIILSVQELERVVHKLPAEYIPETIGVASDLMASKGEPGHVLNRTHYSEYVSTLVDDLSIDSNVVCSWINYDLIKDYKEVTVIYDGSIYECPITVVTSKDGDYFHIGNFQDSALEYPFFIYGYLTNGVAVVNVGEGTHTISVKLSKVVKKLDPRYLPFGHKRYTIEYADSDLTQNDSGTGDSFNASEGKQTEVLNMITELSALTTISINLSVSVPSIGEIMRIPAMLHVKNEANGIDGCLSAFLYEGTAAWWVDNEERVPILGGISIRKSGMTVVPDNWYQIISALGVTIVVDVLHI